MSTIRDSLPLIDARAPRFNQAVIGVLSLAGVVTGAWPLLALAGLQLALTLRFGPRVCLACAVYFRFVAPILGPGPLKDARPVRFANLVGATFLGAATLAWVAGAPGVGAVLGSIVAVLALLAAATGYCVGCEVYKIGARLRGVAGRRVERIDLDELGAPAQDGLVVQFSHPRCSDCHVMADGFTRAGRPHVVVDVAARPDLARKYGVLLVPLAFTVDRSGRVLGAAS